MGYPPSADVPPPASVPATKELHPVWVRTATLDTLSNDYNGSLPLCRPPFALLPNGDRKSARTIIFLSSQVKRIERLDESESSRVHGAAGAATRSIDLPARCFLTIPHRRTHTLAGRATLV